MSLRSGTTIVIVDQKWRAMQIGGAAHVPIDVAEHTDGLGSSLYCGSAESATTTGVRAGRQSMA